MNQTCISYEAAARIKEFLGESAPGPMDWDSCSSEILDGYGRFLRYDTTYQLHDLLSKPFCETFTEKWKGKGWEGATLSQLILRQYYHSGLPAVELALLEMIGPKGEREI
jgi:hypothetical protein